MESGHFLSNLASTDHGGGMSYTEIVTLDEEGPDPSFIMEVILTANI